MEAPAIELSSLSKRYGDVRALEEVSFSVDRGEVFGFLGPNGAGKTTAIRILFDLVRPSGGRATVLGCDCQRDGVAARALMGYLPGDLRLYEDATGLQTARLLATVRRQPPDEAYLSELCGRLSLDMTRRVGELSRGNKQKLGLVLALMHRPRVLVLDEPTSGLDPLMQEEVAELLSEHAAAGNTVFFSSHALPEVERVCQRAAFVRNGRLVAVETIADVKGRSLHIVEVTFACLVPDDAFRLRGVRELRRDGATVHLEVVSNLDAALKAIARYPVLDLRTEQPSLEDVFLAYYRDEAAHPSEAMAR